MKAWLEQVITRAWYRPGISWIWLLFPFALVYWLVTSIRRLLYCIGVFKCTKFSVPVIVVGNVTVGGTGKTPVTIHLVKLLQQLGKKPGVVSRGYGGGYEKPVLAPAGSDPKEVGDEPALIAEQTGALVAVAKRRADAVELLLNQHCDVIVADDGLQHYALARNMEIVVIDGMRGVGNGWLLPTGPLREGLSRCRQADVIVINGDDATGLQQRLNHAVVMQLIPGKLLPLLCAQIQESKALVPQTGDTVHAVCAIDNPQRFFNTLEKLGYNIIPHAFPDHHMYQAEDFAYWQDHPIVMTAKDAVKCCSFNLKNAFSLPVVAEFSDTGSQVITKALADAVQVRETQ